MLRRGFLSRLLGGVAAASLAKTATGGSALGSNWTWHAGLKDWVTPIRVPQPQNIGTWTEYVEGGKLAPRKPTTRLMTLTELRKLATGDPWRIYQEYGVRTPEELLAHYGVR